MSNEIAKTQGERNITDRVLSKVKKYQEDGDIQFPAEYSPENAIKSAWLTLQEVKDSSKRPALEVCTQASIANSVLDMVVQGLNPAKKQGYFIVYGKQLTFQRSYFGTMAVTKRVTGCKSIDAITIHEGDKVTYDIVAGRYTNLKHEQQFGSTSNPIIGAYCTIIEKNGDEYTELMTMDEIKKSWGQSKMNPEGANSTHSKFPVEMAKKTVTNRACKRFLNSSDDSSLLFNLLQENDKRVYEAETQAEIEENANQGETLDIEFEEVADAPTQQETQPEPTREPELELVFANVDKETGEVKKPSVKEEDYPF